MSFGGTSVPPFFFHYSQTVNINASSNSTYILSGWGKAISAMNNGIALHGNNDGDTKVEGQTSSTAPFFGFIVKIVYADTSLEPEYQYVSFNHDCTDWQYVTASSRRSGRVQPYASNNAYPKRGRVPPPWDSAVSAHPDIRHPLLVYIR